MSTHVLLITCVLLGQVVGEPPADIKASVRKLVRQLNHDELVRRQAAEKALIAMGPDVLDVLPGAGRRTPAEVKQRLERIRNTLERAVAEAATRPSLVTLKGEQIRLADVLDVVAEQTGNKIVDFRDRIGAEQREIRLDLDLNKKPFWPALDQILDQAQLTIYSFSGEKNSLAVIVRPQAELLRSDRAAYGGLCRFEATQIQAVRNLRNPEAQGLKLTLEISWEPRSTPIVLEQPLGDISAVDENGEPLEIDDRQGRVDVPVQSGISAVEMDIPLVLPDRNVRKIASLKGRLTALIPGRVVTYRFEDIQDARNVEQRNAGVTVILERVFKNGDLYDVRMRVHFDEAAGALESHRGWIFNNEAYLVGPDERRVANAGFETTRQTRNEVGLGYKFPLDGSLDGYTFVYKTPAAIVSMPIEYELKDIDLP